MSHKAIRSPHFKLEKLSGGSSPQYKVTAKVIDYSQNILKAKVLFKTDEFNIDDEIIIPNYRGKYPEEVVMSNKEIIISYDEFEKNVIIPEDILILEKHL